MVAVQNDEHNYHNSLQAHLMDETGYSGCSLRARNWLRKSVTAERLTIIGKINVVSLYLSR